MRLNALFALYSSKISEEFFEQYITHNNDDKFQQRYYTNNQYYNQTQNIVLILGGEAALKNTSVTKGIVTRLAKENQALLMSLEHRYYGLSHPYNDTTTYNLRHLTVDLALRDIGHFIISMNLKYNLTRNVRKWILVGGSYPGNLAAWSRQQFPGLVYGSLASSAPIEAKVDYYEYDLVVQKALGRDCMKKVTIVKEYIDNEYRHMRIKEIKSIFNCTIRDDKLFLAVLADSLADIVQYNHRGTVTIDSFCKSLEGSNEAESLAKRMALKYQELYTSRNATCLEFSEISQLHNTTIDENKASRQWNYQVCNQFGYFQTAPILPYKSTRSAFLTRKWFYDFYCKGIFGVRSRLPNATLINIKYGGQRAEFDRVIFVNGDLDPWYVLSNSDTVRSTPQVPILLIEKGSHCNDLTEPSPKDSKSLNSTRDSVSRIVGGWFSD